MINLTIVGAAGRMGRRLVALAMDDSELAVVGATETPNNPELGEDAGRLATGTVIGTPVTDDLAKACETADVVIDFSHRDGGLDRARTVLGSGTAYIVGTTGYTDEEKVELRTMADGGRLVFAYNYSVGINMLISLCGKVASILGDDYDIEVIEMHHNQKVDAPSGTAERLAEALAEARGLNYAENTVHGRKGMVGKRGKNEIGMHALRGGDVVGEHTIIFATGGERIELTHKASSRDTFVRGALRAAKFLAPAEPGEYDMREILGID
jgi:4-hydroxy-tetrahydrodipicolinate reductase